MKELEENLYKLFGDVKLVKLSDLVQKIAICSKVRVGPESQKTDKFYEEVSLNDLDEHGIIQLPSKSKDYEKANKTALYNQALNKGDLLLTHRSMKLKIGLYEGRYEHIVIGNSGLMRIQFDKSRCNNTPVYVQAYLQLPLIVEYLNRHSILCSLSIPHIEGGVSYTTGGQSIRRLKAETLLELPIPYFEEGDNPNYFKNLYYANIHICNELEKILQKTRILLKGSDYIRGDALIQQIRSEDKSSLRKKSWETYESILAISATLDKYIVDYNIPKDGKNSIEDEEE